MKSKKDEARETQQKKTESEKKYCFHLPSHLTEQNTVLEVIRDAQANLEDEFEGLSIQGLIKIYLEKGYLLESQSEKAVDFESIRKRFSRILKTLKDDDCVTKKVDAFENKGDVYFYNRFPKQSEMTLREALFMRAIYEKMNKSLPSSLQDEFVSRFEMAHQILQENKLPPYTITILENGVPMSGPKSIESSQIETFLRAILGRQHVILEGYLSRDAAEKKIKGKDYEVIPVCIIIRSEVVYFIVRMPLDGSLRNFASHRCENIKIKQDSSFEKVSFSQDQIHAVVNKLNTFEKELGETERREPEPTIQIRFWTTRNAGYHWTKGESHLGLDPSKCITVTKNFTRSQEKGPEEGYEIQALMTNNNELIWWLLGQSEDIVVLDPPHLRQRIATILERASKTYRGDL